jgi:ribonuclease HI
VLPAAILDHGLSVTVSASTIPSGEASRLNQAIDQFLLDPSSSRQDAVLRISSKWDAMQVAERVRRRATILGRVERGRRQSIIRARDRLVVMLYGHAARAGWHVAWSDASVYGDREGVRAGVGGLLLDAQGRMLAEISAPASTADALLAELMALTVVLRMALEQGVERLRVHTDCDALVAMWLQQRDDPRLGELRDLAGRLRGFDLHYVPRQHNQLAHRLARRAIAGSAAE